MVTIFARERVKFVHVTFNTVYNYVPRNGCAYYELNVPVT